MSRDRFDSGRLTSTSRWNVKKRNNLICASFYFEQKTVTRVFWRLLFQHQFPVLYRLLTKNNRFSDIKCTWLIVMTKFPNMVIRLEFELFSHIHIPYDGGGVTSSTHGPAVFAPYRETQHCSISKKKKLWHWAPEGRIESNGWIRTEGH